MAEFTPEIVIGIDFGTTHSGVSWAVNGGSKVIRLINNWPDPTAQNASKDKVPSSINYVDGKPQKWGYTVGLTDESFKWIKILLEENHKYATAVEPVKDSNTLLTKINKKAHEVVADYLKLLWDYTLEDIQKFHPTFQEIFRLRVVLTVPAMWSHAAKDKTLLAARLAGMPLPIKLVTEPEAAALATLKDKAEENSLKIGDAFVVCDAGGGTVDLISYEVQNLKPLKIRECAIGDGGLCGSVFLDTSFQKCIETLVGKEQYNSLKEINRKKMMNEFEYGIKRTFSEKNTQTYSVDLRGVKDDPEHHIMDDTITVPLDQLRVVFDHVSLQIETLVSNQITEVSEKGLSVKSILLVGGFGENRYLYDRLAKCHKQDGIHVMQVTGAWSSICRGATLWGLEHSGSGNNVSRPDSPDYHAQSATITSRLSRYSYGMAFDEPYNHRLHSNDDYYWDLATGDCLVRDQMTWLLKRGDEIYEGWPINTCCQQIVQVGFWDKGVECFKTDLFCNDEVTPPQRLTDAVRSLCTVHYTVDRNLLWREKSFKSPITKEKHRLATLDMAIIPGNATLEFVISYRGQQVTSVEVDYPEQV